MEINTEHYKSDFQYDIAMFREAAQSPDGDNNRLLWLSRKSGTECFREREAYIIESHAHHAWCYYAGSSDPIMAYAVEITGMESGRVMGNLCELKYPEHVGKIRREAMPAATVDLRFEDGTDLRCSYREFDIQVRRMVDEHGRITYRHFAPENEDTLQILLRQARAERQKYAPAVFKLRIQHPRASVREQLDAHKAAASTTQPRQDAKSRAKELEV